MKFIKWYYNTGYRACGYFKASESLKSLGMRRLSKFVLVLCKRSTGVEFSTSCTIGKNLRIAHGQNIVIGGNTKIGTNCIIYNGVTFGISGRLMEKNGLLTQDVSYPKIGDNCIIYTGAKILGNVQLGNNVIVGANSVVTDDFPDFVIVVGVPARIIKRHNYPIENLTNEASLNYF